VKVALYARVSSAAQSERHTIQSQLRALRDFAAARGWEVVGEYIDDGRSAKAGRLDRRDGFARLIADAAAGAFEVVAVFDLDRLTRSEDIAERGQILGAFQRAGVQVAIATSGQVLDLSSSMGDLFSGLQTFFAAEDNRKRSERTKAGKRRAAAEGRKPGGPTPFGYRFSRDGGWSIDEREAALVRELFARVAGGESCRSLDEDVAERGFVGGRGGAWPRGRVLKIIKSGAYRGSWGGHLAVTVPAIVTEEEWHAAQRQLAILCTGWLTRTPTVHLLAGIAECARCGAAIRVRSHAGRSPTTYVCAARVRRPAVTERCRARHHRAAEVDAALWNQLRTYILRPDLLERAVADAVAAASADAATWQDDLRAAKAALKRSQRAEELILARFRRGLVSEAALDTELAAAARERTLLENQVAAAVRAGEAASRHANRATDFGAAIGEVREMVETASQEERKELVRALLGGRPILVGDDAIRASVAIVSSARRPAACSVMHSSWGTAHENRWGEVVEIPFVVKAS